MKYTIITENDDSQWKDKTGELYHFPKKYLGLLKPGTKLIYYKGKLKNNKYKDKRLSNEPHYFGIAIVEKVYADKNSNKGDHFAAISNFMPFSIPVTAKINGAFIEPIPKHRVNNYWRDGVRPIDEDVYKVITQKSDLQNATESNFNDLNQGTDKAFESGGVDGKKKYLYTSYYERNPKNREQALSIHGYSCMACNFNFEKMYGVHGKDFIHVHHVNPVSETGEVEINPRTDLIVLCANCHSMIHRIRNKTLTLQELKAILNENYR
jgi:putative restriction endonuclease